VLDLAGVSFVACAGVEAVTQACRHAAARGVRVAIIPPPDAARRAFAHCGGTPALPFIVPFEPATLLDVTR
jgi:anti-anti-sigma regulatory factor